MKNSLQKKNIKLVVIGLDGATWDVINPLVNKGWLPNLRSLMGNGCHGYLRSTMPPFSPPAWSSFMTGMNPGKHGIFGFVNFNPESYSQIESKMVTSSTIAGYTIFDILSILGYRIASISVPITYPAWPVNGYMVSGEPIPDTYELAVFPDSFARRLQSRYAFPSSFWSKSNEEIIQGLLAMDDSRTDLAIQLMSEDDLDALFIVLGATDRVQHNFWRFHDPGFGARLGLPHEPKYESVIIDTYRRADENIGRIFSHLGEDTLVFIMSDHGGGPAATNLFHINAWLQENGYLQVEHGKDNLARDMHKTVLYLRRLMDTPVGSKLRQVLPEKMVSQGRALVRNIAQINWHETRAYRFPIYPPLEGIVINVAGRQPQGIVNPGDDYERIRREICDQLRHVTDPVNGGPLIIDIFLREEIYSGPHIERSPDIILVLKENFTGGTGLSSTLTSPVDPLTLKKVNGEHRMNGILLARGPMIKENWTIEGACLQDIAPTLLYSLGLPVSDKMDGQVLEALFTQDFLLENPEVKSLEFKRVEPVLPEFSLTKEDELQIEEQLKKLGYL